MPINNLHEFIATIHSYRLDGLYISISKFPYLLLKIAVCSGFKSINLMRNFLNLLLLSLAFGAQSQTMTTHPISYYGIGEIGQQSHSIYDALGRSYVSYFDSSQLNIFNPSTYSNLTTGNTLLSIGINARASQYSQTSSK